MTNISLDQNVVSNLVKNNKEAFWREMREQLLYGVKRGKFRCPVPQETIAETIPCGREVRIKIRDLSEQLSRGWFFRDFTTIVGLETLALVRCGATTVPYERGIWHSVGDDVLAQAKTLEQQQLKQEMQQAADDHVFAPGRRKFAVNAFRSDVLLECSGSLFRQIERLLADKLLDPEDDLTIGVCHFLIRSRITKVELECLLDKVVTREWVAIPAVFFDGAIRGLLEHGRVHGRKYQVNDELDIHRLATALHCEAIFITERSMTNLARELEKECAQPLSVFWFNQRDEIRAKLDALIHN